MKRKIDNRTYLSQLLQYLNVNDLKAICKEFNIKGYSKLKKSELIEFILDSISEEEMNQLIELKELEIVNDGIQVALKKINGEDRENISKIKIVNTDAHEIELKFKGMNWEITSYLSITPDNIDNPERDCDCRIGSNNGFCTHFWVGVIFSFKQGWIKVKDWSLTILPEDFEKTIKTIKITSGSMKDESDEISLINESSEDYPLMENLNKSITIYEAVVSEVEMKIQQFQDISTTYYLVSLNNVRFGPKLKRKSDFREEDINVIEYLNLRISEKLQEENNLYPGDKIKVNGKLTKDNFLRMFIVKNIRKIEKF